MGQVLPGVLDDEHHDRLWVGRIEYCADANIPIEHLYSDPTEYLGEAEINYFRRSPKRLIAEDRVWGLYYAGAGYKPPVALRMSIMAGWYLRKFTRARVVLMNDLLAQIDANEPPDISVVLVPDFYMFGADQRTMPSWKIRQVYSWLLQRFQKSQQTILAVSDLDTMAKNWGAHFGEHLSEFFAEVSP